METNNKFFTAAEIFVRLLSAFPKKASEISKVNVMRWCSEVVTEYLTDPVGMIPHYKYQLGIRDGSGTVVNLVSITEQPTVSVPSAVFYRQSTNEICTLALDGVTVSSHTAGSAGVLYLFAGTYYRWTTTLVKVTYTIVDGKVELPTDCFKLEAVYDQNNSLVKDCSTQGQYIQFSSRYMPTAVYIDYYSIPADAQGFPLIKRGYEAACYAYCVYKMFEEDAGTIPPRIPQWRWFQICEDKEHELGAARSSWSDMTDNDIRDIHNYIIDPAYIRMITKTTYGDILDGGSIFNQK